MKITFMRVIVAEGRGGGATLSKYVDLPFAPWVGMEVEDPTITSKVEGVLLELGCSDDETTVIASLGMQKVGSTKEVNERIEMYKDYDWVPSGKDTHA